MIKLTETMLNKYIIDANESVVDSLRFWVDFGGLKHGQKKCISARVKNGGNTVVCCYLANRRGDRRISIKGLRKQAEAGDSVVFSQDFNNFLTVSILKRKRGR